MFADDEALIVVHLGEKGGYVWAITGSAADWKELPVTADEITKNVFADPVFDSSPLQLAENTRAVANVTAARGIRGTVADLAELKTALPPLRETAHELKEVAASVQSDPAGVILGHDATETRVKQAKLDQYRIVYFATHGLLAGNVADFAKLSAEPALVLSLPEHPTESDDGLLTASEVARLKLNADWVVLSACMQKSMLTMIDNARRPERADPKHWAPFDVVGQPAKPAN